MNQMVIAVAMLAALGIVGVFVVTTVQQAEAINNAGIGLDAGCKNGIAINASKGRCFSP